MDTDHGHNIPIPFEVSVGETFYAQTDTTIEKIEAIEPKLLRYSTERVSGSRIIEGDNTMISKSTSQALDWIAQVMGYLRNKYAPFEEEE